MDRLSRRQLGCLTALDDVAWGRWLLLADRLEGLDPDYVVEDYGFKWEYFYLHVRSASAEAHRLVDRFVRQVNDATDRDHERARVLQAALDGARRQRLSRPAARSAADARAGRSAATAAGSSPG